MSRPASGPALGILALAFVAAFASEARAQGHIDSASNQRFHVGDPDTNAATISITCQIGDITGTGNIRIEIPATFNMEWDTSILDATDGLVISDPNNFVASSVSYPDSKTMFLDVTVANFIPGLGISISGLRFRNFSGPSATDNLELIKQSFFDPDLDSQTIRIHANPTAFSSAASQTFNVNDPPTPMSAITITDHTTNPGIWSATGIRIRIPAGLDMTWWTGDNVASCSGSAVTFGHVSPAPTVSFEDSNKTIVIPVLNDFSPSITGRTLTISGLSFANFNTQSGPASLQLEVNNQGTVARTDPQTIEIGGEPTLSSQSSQTFTVGDPVTSAGTLTVTDAPGIPTITAANDIRIRIPSTFNMTWDTSVTTPGLAVTGTGAVSPLVSYPDSRTLFINVTSNFGALAQLTITGLSFTSFSASSPADTLELEVDGDPTPEALDDKTKAIGAPTLSSTGDQIFQVGDPTTAMLPATVRDDGVTPVITAANDIRIRIPAGFNMQWDTGDTTATIAMLGAGAVSGTVSYPDTRTLRLNVTTDFGPGARVTVSGLSFTNFSAPSLPDNLELVVNGALNTVADEDNRIIAVGGAPSISSLANQAFTVNDPATPISTITVTDANGFPTITAANDIRIRIPAGFNMEWDPSDTSVTVTVTGSGAVSSTVSYDSPAILVLDVTTDFAVNDTVTVSGLSFTNFSGPSAADNLELEVDNAGTGAATDDKTIAIGAPAISSGANQVFGTGDPPTPISPITVTDDGATPRITAANDIRIRIPAGFNMRWDLTDTTATVTGSGSGAASGTVSYDDPRTLVVNVTTDFGAGNSITISDLSFASFTAESATDFLELEVNNQNTVVASDDKTLLISNRPGFVSAVTGDVNANGSIDRLIVTFSEDIDGATTSVTSGAGFGLTGYTIAFGSETAPGVLTFTLAETGLPDTGATPALSYDPVTGSLLDLDGLEMNAISAFTASDGAAPRIVGIAANDTDSDGFLDEIVFTYSETLAAGQEDLSDWTLVDADGTTDLLAGLTNANVTLSGSLVTLTLADTTGTAGAPRYRYQEDGLGGAIQDGTANTAPQQTNNSFPIADAGPDATTAPIKYILDGTGSSDADGQPLTFAWIQTAGPGVSLKGPGTATPEFTATTPATYSFLLTVTDGLDFAQDSVDITVANVPPTADAGFDQTVFAGAVVTLDGSASSDVNGDALTFSWNQIAGPAVTLVGAATANPSFNSAGINAVLEFELTATDTAGNTDTDTVRVIVNAAGNGVPAANAGADQVATLGSLVTLDGRLSTDPDGDALTFSWSPAGVLTGPTTSTPSFTPTFPGRYTFQLTVTDGAAVDSAPDTVEVFVHDVANAPPVAVAVRSAPLGDVVLGDTVTLDGSGSSDPEGATVQYAWTQIAGPRAFLSNPAAVQPTFSPILPGTYGFQLVATDGVQQSPPVRVFVPVKPTAADTIPVAVAIIDPADDPDGDGRVSSTTAPIGLDGTASTGTGLSFVWVQGRGPTTVLTGPTAAMPSFTPTVSGVYEFTLVVTDANGVRNAARLEIVVDTPANESPTANAGPDSTGSEGQVILLDGSLSSDPATDADGVTDFTNGLLAFWGQVAGPPAALSDPSSPMPTFVPTDGGTYVFSLRVSDGTSESSEDLIVVTVAFAGPQGGGGGGGGRCGLTGWEAFLLLGILAGSRGRRSRA